MHASGSLGTTNGFVLFSPDCTVTGRHREAIDWLYQRGIVFCAFVWKKLSTAEVDFLYQENRRRRGRDSLDELVDRLFTLDQSLAALVEAPGIQDIHSYLAELKGPSDPAKSTPHHLRRWLGATNKILNFIHTSSTANDAARESRLFFETANRQSSSPMAELPAAPGSLSHLPSISGLFVRCKLKRSAVSTSSLDVPSRLRELLELEWHLVNSIRDHLSILPDLRKLLLSQAQEIQRIRQEDPLTILLADLCSRSLGPRPDTSPSQALRLHLQRLGLGLSDWDDLILACDQWDV